MKYIKHLGYIIVVMLMAVALVLACAPAPAPAPAPMEPIKIGAIVGLTGFMSIDAQDSIRGVELKLDEVGWEVAGRKIELISEDGASEPATYVDKARKLVEADKVDVILGPLFSPAAFAIADYLTASRTPNLAFLEHSKGVLEFGGGNVFMWAGSLMGNSYPLGEYAYDVLGYRTATHIYPDHATGEEFAEGFVKAFEAKGGTTVQRQRIPPMNLDFAANLTSMKQADAVVFWFAGPQLPTFLTQYRDSGLKMPLIMTLNAPANEIALAEAGDITIGMVGSGPYTPLIDTDVNKRFVDAFVKKYDLQPRAESAGGYIATTMFLEAVKATGGDTSHEAIINALHQVKVDTPAGTISYTPEGLGIADLYILKVIKIGDRYAWDVIKKFSQIEIAVPE